MNVVIAYLHSMIALWMRFEMLREQVEIGLEAWKEVSTERAWLGFYIQEGEIIESARRRRAWATKKVE